MKRKMVDKEGARFCSACGEKLIGNDRYCIKCANKRKLDNPEIAQNLSKKAELKAWVNLFKIKERKGMGFLNLNFDLTPELPRILPQIYAQKLS